MSTTGCVMGYLLNTRMSGSRVQNVAEPVQAYAVRFENLKKDQGAPAELKTKKISIAVLPFNNMSTDPEQSISRTDHRRHYHYLSHLRWLNVIAQLLLFLQGQSPDIRGVGRAHCRYVLEGSVRRGPHSPCAVA